MKIYVVKVGDNIDSIAENQNVDVNRIIYINQLIYPYKLAVGQALLLDGAVDTTNEKRTIVVNGYAYPFINSWVLEETLPFLSELSVFSYGFTTDGELIVPWYDDTYMINRAIENMTLPIMTLTPLDREGNFNNNLISAVVRDEETKWTLIGNVYETLVRKGFGGVNVDFEFILAEDRDAFTSFVEDMTVFLNESGYLVSVALAPKTSAEQKGLLYEGKDYRRLGEIANSVLVMTYEWGYTYGPPMAVAPINQVRRVLDYAVTEIESTKIDLGIPNYGYDWPLPYVRGVTRAKTIGNVEAVQIAIENNAEIQFDETAMSPYFRYFENGVEHEVWFEDVRSMSAKFELIKEYNMRGAGYWQIMQLFRANWLLLNDKFNIKKV